MVKEVVALQGKEFTVTLQSMVGSTGYGWYLTSLPSGIAFLYEEKIPIRPGISPVNHVFHFGVINGDLYEAQIMFSLLAPWKLEEIADTYIVQVQIVPHNTDRFVPYSENAQSCSAENAVVKYGYQCSVANASTPPATYNCSDTADPILKYGYPCGVADASKTAIPYGYCSTTDPILKYGYPCGVADASKTAIPYGYCLGSNNGNYTNVATDYGLPYYPNQLYGYYGCR